MAWRWNAPLAAIVLAACSHGPVDQSAMAAAHGNARAAATLDGSNPLQSGRELMASGEPARAAERFKMAVDADPNDPVALNNLAIARANLGDYRTAYDLLQRASALAPQRADIVANRDRLAAWLNSRANVSLSNADADAPVPNSAATAEVPPLWDASEAEQVIAPAVGATDMAGVTAIPLPIAALPAPVSGAIAAPGSGASKTSNLMLDPGESVVDPGTLKDPAALTVGK